MIVPGMDMVADTEQGWSPLARLVLFMVCLAIAASGVAGLHYYAVDLPQQSAVVPPVNAGCEGGAGCSGPVGCTSLCNGQPGCIEACLV